MYVFVSVSDYNLLSLHICRFSIECVDVLSFTTDSFALFFLFPVFNIFRYRSSVFFLRYTAGWNWQNP